MKSGRLKWILIALLLLAGVMSAFLRSPVDESYHVGPAIHASKVAPQISISWDSAVMLAPNGTLWALGGSQSQLAGALPKPTISEIPVQIGTKEDWAKIAGGSWGQTIALKTNGTLWGWGGNASGQLTSANPKQVPAPVQIGTNSNWFDVSCGASHVMGLRKDSTLWLWGQNNYGQIGDGSTHNRLIPYEITNNFGWRAISASSFNSYAISGDGHLWGWGLSGLGGGRATNPNEKSPVLLDASTNWISISAGEFHLIALRRDGTIWIRGQNAHIVSPSTTSTPLTNLVQIGSESDWREIRSASEGFFARKNDGSWWVSGSIPWLWAFGAKSGTGRTAGLNEFPKGFSPWSITSNGVTTLILGRDGRLWTTGERLGYPDKLGRFRRPIAWLGKIIGKNWPAQPTTKTDQTPHLIWKWDDSVPSNP